jgi:hypothetical protein
MSCSENTECTENPLQSFELFKMTYPSRAHFGNDFEIISYKLLLCKRNKQFESYRSGVHFHCIHCIQCTGLLHPVGSSRSSGSSTATLATQTQY